jgi:uncharacterized RDD family membrane protein YckC
MKASAGAPEQRARADASRRPLPEEVGRLANGPLEPPGLWRRLACFVYEGVLLFGVLMAAGLLYAGVTQQRHALQGKLGLQVFVFVVLGAYFVGFWSHGGQTLAMKTWHLRLVRADGMPLGRGRAFVRYLLSWAWFLPALAAVSAFRVHRPGAIFGIVLAGVVAYAALARLRGDRQFWHDVACGTRLVVDRGRTVKAESSG